MQKSKLYTYLGFCVRARKMIYGVDDIDGKKKGVYLIIGDETLGDSSQKLLIKAQQRLSCPLLLTKQGELGALLHKPFVKAVAIVDKNLASAILSVAESEMQWKLYSGGSR